MGMGTIASPSEIQAKRSWLVPSFLVGISADRGYVHQFSVRGRRQDRSHHQPRAAADAIRLGPRRVPHLVMARRVDVCRDHRAIADRYRELLVDQGTIIDWARTLDFITANI